MSRVLREDRLQRVSESVGAAEKDQRRDRKARVTAARERESADSDDKGKPYRIRQQGDQAHGGVQVGGALIGDEERDGSVDSAEWTLRRDNFHDSAEHPGQRGDRDQADREMEAEVVARRQAVTDEIDEGIEVETPAPGEMPIPEGDDLGLVAGNRSPQHDHDDGQDSQYDDAGAERPEQFVDELPVRAHGIAEADCERAPDQSTDYRDRHEISRSHPGQTCRERNERASYCDEAADEYRRAAEVLEVVLDALAMLFVMTSRESPSRQHGLSLGVAEREPRQVAKHRGADDGCECGPQREESVGGLRARDHGEGLAGKDHAEEGRGLKRDHAGDYEQRPRPGLSEEILNRGEHLL